MWLMMLAACDGGFEVGASRAVSFGDSGAPLVQTGPGILVLAGGGSEGDEGDTESWSARLYAHLLDGGDVTGDGLVRVVILSTEDETDWLPEYFEWLGADEAVNLRVGSRDFADVTQVAADYDAVFIKGGDQSEYYDLWSDTVLAGSIRSVHDDYGGGVGGTSAGAMALAGYAWVADQDLISLDVLSDCQTPYLVDSDGSVGLRSDFLGLVDDWVIDTHATERGRLGRLIGLVGTAHATGHPIEGVGISEQTGLWIEEGVANVVGDGAVTVVHGGEWTCTAGAPPAYADLSIDRLTDGWTWAIATNDLLPADGAEMVAWDGGSGEDAGTWAADGDLPADEERFAWVADRDPEPYATHAGSAPPLLADGIGILDAHDDDRRGANEETAFRALYDHIGAAAYLVPEGTRLELEAGLLRATDNPDSDAPPASVILLDSSTVTWRGLSPSASNADVGDTSLHAAALVGLTAHLLYTPTDGVAYDPLAHGLLVP